MMRKKLTVAVMCLAAVSAVLATDGAEHALGAPNDKEALAGLSEVKLVFDVSTGDSKKLLGRLALVEETRDGIIQQGRTPHIVLMFRGGASLLLQKDRTRIKPEDVENVAMIWAKIKTMAKDKSLQFGQCAVANRYLKIKNEDTIPEIVVIGNGFVSMAAYQNKGYAYIPID